MQSVTQFEGEFEEYSWMISTIQTKRLCRFTDWFQHLAQETEAIATKLVSFLPYPQPQHFILKEPQKYMDMIGLNQANVSRGYPGRRGDTVTYEFRNITIDIGPEMVEFSLKSDQDTILDAVSGFFEIDEVSLYVTNTKNNYHKRNI